MNLGGLLYPLKSDGRNSFGGYDACETDSATDSPLPKLARLYKLVQDER